MKVFKSVILLLIFSITMGFSQTNTSTLKISEERIEVKFDDETQWDDLDDVKTTLDKRDVEVVYNNVVFNEDGYLHGIKFSVACKDGFSGTASSLPLTMSEIGFYRDYSEDSRSPFGTANMSNN